MSRAVKVNWTRPANADVLHIVRHIAKDDIGAAFRVADQIVESTAKLGQFPRIGRATRRPSVRELIVVSSAYIVLYRIERRKIQILRVLHGAQRRPD